MHVVESFAVVVGSPWRNMVGTVPKDGIAER
jgi:hypothetical protein